MIDPFIWFCLGGVFVGQWGLELYLFKEKKK